MKHISKFSKFNEDHSGPEFRLSEEVSIEEFHKKIQTFGRVEFTNGEKEFFKKFGDENGDTISYHPIIPNHYFAITINDSKGYYLGSIEITKLNDDWYAITKGSKFESIRHYICDDWEEVLGYLSGCGYDFRI